MFSCFIPDINQCVNSYFGTGKSLILSLLNSRYSNGFRLTKTNFVFDLVSLDCRLRLLKIFFWIIFQNKRLYLPSSCFSNLFNASARLFSPLSFAQSREILSKFSKFSAILKHGGKNVMITSIGCLSSNRSQARTNQNARITWAII